MSLNKDTLLSKLNKKQILLLPGFSDKSKNKLTELKDMLKKKIVELKLKK